MEICWVNVCKNAWEYLFAARLPINYCAVFMAVVVHCLSTLTNSDQLLPHSHQQDPHCGQSGAATWKRMPNPIGWDARRTLFRVHGICKEVPEHNVASVTDPRIQKYRSNVMMDLPVPYFLGITEFPSKVKLHGFLDVYWIVRDGGLCVLITFLLRQSRVWRHCKIRIVAVAGHLENNVKIKAQLKNYIYQLRIDAEVIVTELSDPELSKTAFERSLLMEERTKMLRHINQKKSNDLSISSAGYKTPNMRPMSTSSSTINLQRKTGFQLYGLSSTRPSLRTVRSGDLETNAKPDRMGRQENSIQGPWNM
ncbi:solute carrier family 12 domain-containing protein [Ditylenchus destructor]|nr:solute carrier family 12 domain-containing protein [Ditylenchus destructor]